MFFNRQLKLENFRTSAFLFGPRMVGKTTLLRALKVDAYFDLLDPALELEYKSNPEIFWQQLAALRTGSRIVIDEVQKAPVILNYVQMAMDKMDHKFILSGSSSRKLKRGGANLLGGRAMDLKLHPLSWAELSEHFSLETALEYGTLPKIYSLIRQKQTQTAREHLRSYISTYLKEEIQTEALTRNLGSFNRFLQVAAQSNGQVVEMTNISRECSVPASTVKEYFQILEDTLIGFFLWPWERSERKKARPKFYFFDCGVVRAVQNRLNDPPVPAEKGYLFETWFINELKRIRDYSTKDHEFSFWRHRDQEIDIIVSKGLRPVLAFECKSGRVDVGAPAINNFRKVFGKIPLVVVSLTDRLPRETPQTKILPLKEALTLYQQL